ncbi:hypothetical protein At1D1609_50690 [Agrobacterium tumefaciens]|uniref:Uncharacterized protein n=1 Tax=Agrobacterium tumefaciens TaxID=358 RepID=A0A2L2LLC5_AGRTU|nr:hypothetical protein At1D1609_50690 [Agrobacterium tumefaciens]
MLACFFGWSVAGAEIPGCVPFVHNEIMGAEIAGKQTSVSLLLLRIDWRGLFTATK